MTGSSEYSGQGENGDVEDSNGHEQDMEEEGGGEELKEVVMKAWVRARWGWPGYFDLHPQQLQQMHCLDIEEDGTNGHPAVVWQGGCGGCWSWHGWNSDWCFMGHEEA
jgi:hypothetical protein